ncbi:thioredoxin-like domain-containing protein [Winogradskyella sp.]|jgi:thiol-disulfide isomerase/thioredoxin|uniref:TlpA family protein disulfide reductase n=1 Tax=Winogradskyella sp. TaxID=1883156 RepID=UPI0025D0AE26|nr:thioredoxin-like domain-containing protein [Winogradskyella sp.]MCT4630474.1 thioredoxin family protein [Winogradskyella sp.]
MKFRFNLLLLTCLCFTFVFFACNGSKSTNPNTISIEISGTNQPDSIQLLNYNKSEAITITTNERPFIFHQKDTIHDAFKINVFNNKKVSSKKIFLNGKHINLKGKLTAEQFMIDTVTNSDIYYKQMHFYATLDSLKTLKVNDSIINNILLKQIKECIHHPLSFEISDYYIAKNKNHKPLLKDLQIVLEKQPEDLKTHSLSIHRELNKLLKQERLELSEFNFYDKNGKVSKVSTTHNGDYLIDFWFVHCPPCVKDHKKIATYLDVLSNKNTELIGISIDTVEDKWLHYLETNNYNWQNYRELRKGNDLVDTMNVWEFPTYILISNTGEVKTKFYSFEEIANYFNDL